MSEKKELAIEELERICGGIDKNFMGLTEDELKELNILLNECYNAVLVKDRDKFMTMIPKVRDFRDAHLDAYDYVNNVIKLLKEIWRKTEIWF